MIGSAAKVYRSDFESNRAVVDSTDREAAALGYGGAVNLQTGSSVECFDVRFRSNAADVGGAVFVRDGSFEGKDAEFVDNAALDGGVGGGAAVEVSRGKVVPVLNSGGYRLNIAFLCDRCCFLRNYGSLAGGAFPLVCPSEPVAVSPGAIHVHDMDPGGTFAEDNELTNDGCVDGTSSAFSDRDNALTCPSYSMFVRMVDARSVRFRNTVFAENVARAGGAIFTNNLSMISVMPDMWKVADKSVALGYVLQENEAHLEKSNVTFIGNSVEDGGYGESVASTPVTALLTDLDDGGGRPETTLTKSAFLSGDRLRFKVEFKDGLDESVTFADRLTARISCDGDRSDDPASNCALLEISGQETAEVNEKGMANFTAVRLRGLESQTYTLRVEYRSTSELQTLNAEQSVVRVTMRPCQIGERTVSEAGDLLECQECSSSTYNLVPGAPECQPCPANGNCESRVIVPDSGYWQDSPCSASIARCLTSHACKFRERDRKLGSMTDDLSNCDISEKEIEEYQKAQCAQVRLVICGSSPVRCPLCDSRVIQGRSAERARTAMAVRCRPGAESVRPISATWL